MGGRPVVEATQSFIKARQRFISLVASWQWHFLAVVNFITSAQRNSVCGRGIRLEDKSSRHHLKAATETKSTRSDEKGEIGPDGNIQVKEMEVVACEHGDGYQKWQGTDTSECDRDGVK